MIGAFVAFSVAPLVGYLPAIAVAMIVNAGLGVVLERTAFRPFRGAELNGLIASMGMSIILINIAERKMQVLRGHQVLYTTTVAVGAPGMETPTGHYYVQVRFHPDDTFLGVFAFETSAYSKLSDWPGGGVVGLHGWADPSVLGKAVSHGCIRVSNTTAAFLRDRIPVGTPIRVVAT